MKIFAIPNKLKMQVNKIKMTCDDDGLNVPYPLQKSNFFYIISGQPA